MTMLVLRRRGGWGGGGGLSRRTLAFAAAADDIMPCGTVVPLQEDSEAAYWKAATVASLVSLASTVPKELERPKPKHADEFAESLQAEYMSIQDSLSSRSSLRDDVDDIDETETGGSLESWNF